MTLTEKRRIHERLIECICSELNQSPSRIMYQIFGSSDGRKQWHGMVMVFRRDAEASDGLPYLACTLAEEVPWQILEKAADLGKRMEAAGVDIVEMVPYTAD